MSEHRLDCLIVGAGPAGLTAATYLARFRRRVALVSFGESRARYMPATHNCPGFPFGMSGGAMLAKLTDQAAQFGVHAIKARVQRIEPDQFGFVVRSDEHRWTARTVLLATGIVDRLPPVMHIERGIADDVVRICAVCDGYEAQNNRIVVYGPPSSVVQHARFLRTYSQHVTVVLSEPGVLAPDDRLLAIKLNIDVLPPPLKIRLVKDSNRKIIACEVIWADRTETFDTLYPVLGADAKAGLATALGASVDEFGELIVDNYLQTTVNAMYAAGDVASALNQISVAVGHAAIAATAIHHRLSLNAL
ncbi:MAG TPA: NAD(P)/FAD-dependent oxidoreductase [Xanthomonadaceae bacterium]|jgi:thioredoxin reductase (NADPH)|nr:NAD(P)/FAD-dependent oxidoreductase [Xanthomonadaceae bacterium]